MARRTVLLLGMTLVAPPCLVAATLPAVLPMSTRVYKDQSSQSIAIDFAGRVPATGADERVVLLVRECGTRFFRQIGGTRTTAGGAWQMTVGGGYGFPFAPSGSTYQARWRGRPTAPFTWRTRLHPSVVKLGPSRFLVTVGTSYAQPLQTFRSLMLQRLEGGRFVDVRSIALRAADARTFRATITVPTPGLTLRVLATAAAARPCYNAGASETFRSG